MLYEILSNQQSGYLAQFLILNDWWTKNDLILIIPFILKKHANIQVFNLNCRRL